jgi:penicillin-binding protein 2
MIRALICVALLGLLVPSTFAAHTRTKARARKKTRKRKPARPAVAHHRVRKSAVRRLPAVDPTAGDNVDGDDLPVRRAAVEALGPYNGTVVVVDPQTGRILTIVNQKTAFESGFTPCSTIKLVTALAALREGLVQRYTLLHLTRRSSLDLTDALAHSNNPYFRILGDRLGFQRVLRYARLFGLGELAGWHIAGEQPGILPEAPAAYGGVGMLTAFGEGFKVTPLELAALVSAIANGGALYYLQYPRNQQEIQHFAPRVKRQLDIAPWIADVKTGMRAAVDSGTARRAGYDPSEPILGKTGTCTDFRAYTHLGWFGSFNDVARNKLVVVVLLTGGRAVNGPIAAGVGGAIYRQLSQQNFFASAPLLSTQSCCAQ